MKNNSTIKSATMLALMGLLQVSNARAEGHSFTPIENLPPEQRQQISAELEQLTKGINIDWDEIAVGIDENGKITLVPKSQSGMRQLASPSTFGSVARTNEECK